MSLQKPITEIRIGAVKATLWRERHRRSAPHNVTFSRLYKDRRYLEVHQSFGRNDLLLLAKVADQAHSAHLPARASRRRGSQPGGHQGILTRPAAAGITPRRGCGRCGKPEESTLLPGFAREATDGR